MKTIDIIEEVEDAINKLNAVENYMTSLNDELSKADLRVTDLEHYIENNKINALQANKIIKELQKVLLERRKIKNDIELAKTYRANDTKLVKKKNRELFLEDLHEREKELNKEFKNRVYTKEQIEEIVGEK